MKHNSKRGESPRRWRGAHGFTLLEIITAVAIMSVLSLSLYATLSISFRAKASASRAIEPARTLMLSINMVADEFRTVVPISALMAFEFVGYDELGPDGFESDIVRFYNTAVYTPWPDGASFGFREVELMLVDDEVLGGSMLVRHTLDTPMAPIRDEPVETIICRGVRAFNLRYYDGSEWLDEWDSAEQNETTPRAVEITIELEPESGQLNDVGPLMTTIVNLPTGGATGNTEEGTLRR